MGLATSYALALNRSNQRQKSTSPLVLRKKVLSLHPEMGGILFVLFITAHLPFFSAVEARELEPQLSKPLSRQGLGPTMKTAFLHYGLGLTRISLESQ